ncbi:MAG: DUF4129 domain-containing protein [Planctomycetota bacterium]|jgi:hypothetical protein
MNAVALLLLLQPLALGQTEEDWDRVGQEALDQWWPSNYPWYDPETDGVRRVEIPKPRDWSWLWNGLKGARDWLWGLLPDWNLSWLWDWLRGWNWRSLLKMPATFWGWFGRIGLVVLVGVLMYVLVWAIRKWGRFLPGSAAREGKSKTPRSGDQQDADRIEALPFPVRSGRLDLLGETRRHYQKGDYRQAIIYLFSFQLVRLDRQQIIRLTKGKTNRQYLREVGPRSALGRLVEQTMVVFEDVFFGNRRLDRTRFESCWSRLDEFESLAAEGVG